MPEGAASEGRHLENIDSDAKTANLRVLTATTVNTAYLTESLHKQLEATGSTTPTFQIQEAHRSQISCPG